MSEETSAAAEAPKTETATADINQSDDAQALQDAVDILQAEDIGTSKSFDKPAEEEKPAEPVAEAKPEEKAEPEPAEKKEEEKEPEGSAASGWAKVRKAEQRLLRDRKEAKAQQDSMQAQMTQIQEQGKQLQEMVALATSDPIKFLEQRGIAGKDLAGRLLNEGKATPEELAKQGTAETKTLREELAETRQMVKDLRHENQISKYRDGVHQAMKEDDFSLIRTYDGDVEAEVVDFANKWAEAGRGYLPPREALGKLQEAWRDRLKGLSSHEAVRNLLGVAEAKADPPPTQQQSGPSQVPQAEGARPQTLTNNLAATPPVEPPANFSDLPEEEQIRIALRAAPG